MKAKASTKEAKEKKVEKQIEKKAKPGKDEFGYKVGSVNHLFAKMVMSADPKAGISSTDIMKAEWNKRASRLWGSMKDMIDKNLIPSRIARCSPARRKNGGWRNEQMARAD